MQQHYDLIKVAAVNVTAFIVSLTDLETSVRIAGMLVAMVYTGLKTYYLIAEKRERKK
ncbi:MAG TPA: hypothetical protein VNQ90_17640 [Chthoniobacteraceae bacterium]|nr:hypothetical protein [Chthoniobacteraceae bacterium]